jgi:hypothetical protein
MIGRVKERMSDIGSQALIYSATYALSAACQTAHIVLGVVNERELRRDDYGISRRF